MKELLRGPRDRGEECQDLGVTGVAPDRGVEVRGLLRL